MTQSDDDEGKLRRRGFLKTVGLAGAAGALPAPAQAQMQNMAMPAQAASGDGAVYLYFNADEVRFVEAAVDTLIPKDAVGPGALETGVAVFIDNQLAGAYGKGARLYMQGPFAEGVPGQGYQSPLVPAELIRVGIQDAEAWCQASRKKDFASLTLADRAAVLTEIESGKAEFTHVPPVFFFNQLLQITMEGYFADPAYGGNKDKAVWKMIGFPGARGMYSEDIETYRNKPYPLTIRTLADKS